MCRNSSAGFLVLTNLGMKIPEKQRGTGDRMEGKRECNGNEERTCCLRPGMPYKSNYLLQSQRGEGVAQPSSLP